MSKQGLVGLADLYLRHSIDEERNSYFPGKLIEFYTNVEKRKLVTIVL